MFNTQTLKHIYATFLTEDGNPFEHHNVLDSIKTGDKFYQKDILSFLETAIADKNGVKLRFCLAASFRDGMDDAYAQSLLTLMLATWHDDHKALVDAACFLKDERFCESILTIALNKVPYRKYDDGDEMLLRKCVHVLKAIDSKIADKSITKLLATKNPNVEYALAAYNHNDPCQLIPA